MLYNRLRGLHFRLAIGWTPHTRIMRITALEPQRRRTDRLNLYIDGEFHCAIASEIALRYGLRSGEAIEPATLEEMLREDLEWNVRESALRLLAVRARSESELRSRLLRKQFPRDVVEACVAGLVERGLVDDREFAASFARDRVKLRPRGARLLVQELRARGVSETIAAAAVEEALAGEEVDEAELALRLAESWMRRSSPSGSQGDVARRYDSAVLRRRLYGYLARRGFDADAIRSAMDHVLSADSR